MGPSRNRPSSKARALQLRKDKENLEYKCFGSNDTADMGKYIEKSTKRFFFSRNYPKEMYLQGIRTEFTSLMAFRRTFTLFFLKYVHKWNVLKQTMSVSNLYALVCISAALRGLGTSESHCQAALPGS